MCCILTIIMCVHVHVHYLLPIKADTNSIIGLCSKYQQLASLKTLAMHSLHDKEDSIYTLSELQWPSQWPWVLVCAKHIKQSWKALLVYLTTRLFVWAHKHHAANLYTCMHMLVCEAMIKIEVCTLTKQLGNMSLILI